MERHDDVVEVYAHNLPAVELWADVWNQWRWIPAGMGGAVRGGLDWAQVEAVIRMRGKPRRERSGLLDDLRTMEHEALQVLREQSKHVR